MRLGVGLPIEVRLERQRWQSASGLVIITGKGDLNDYWFEAGRTYLRISLTIESLGLAQATSAAIVEALDYHKDLETALGTSQRVLAIMRIGRGSSKKHFSPRLDTAQIIT